MAIDTLPAVGASYEHGDMTYVVVGRYRPRAMPPGAGVLILVNFEERIVLHITVWHSEAHGWKFARELFKQRIEL